MRVAALQYCAAGDPASNRALIADLAGQAADKGADLVCLPECANFIAPDRASLHRLAEPAMDSPSCDLLAELAAKYQIHLAAGSLMLRDSGAQKIANRSLLYGPDGQLLASYDKINMFDADVGDGKTYRESDDFAAGDRLVTARIGDYCAGLSVCYDLRFAGLYRQLTMQGANLLLIPAAFTATTGAGHWHALLRARAIENGAFVIAAAQGGRHADQRQTYGHALICDPWGQVMADAGEADNQPHIALADLDMDQLARARGALKAWSDFRVFS